MCSWKKIFSKSLGKNFESEPTNIGDNEIVAPIDGKKVDLSELSDPLFSKKVLGETVAFKTQKNFDVVVAPINGTIKALYPTGHAFGIKNKTGLEVLVHIGINTVNAKGKGFKILNTAKGNKVVAGTPIVKVNFSELQNNYDLPILVIITNNVNPSVKFKNIKKARVGQVISQQSFI